MLFTFVVFTTARVSVFRERILCGGGGGGRRVIAHRSRVDSRRLRPVIVASCNTCRRRTADVVLWNEHRFSVCRLLGKKSARANRKRIGRRRCDGEIDGPIVGGRNAIRRRRRQARRIIAANKIKKTWVFTEGKRSQQRGMANRWGERLN